MTEAENSTPTGAHAAHQWGNRIANRGFMYRCAACGKRSLDKYGEQPIDHGFDESCALNSVLVAEQK